ncbi:Isocitrate/isopropylmalate dehydrogenase [Fragilaria crotonensis]|nr:Isocitrate/isopropylmalate dehydrogenase [Fragilaria crotonensis]
MNHAAMLDADAHPESSEKQAVKDKVLNFTETLRRAIHNTFRYGQGTKDMSGPSGFSTEAFIDKVEWRLNRYLAAQLDEAPPPTLSEPSREFRRNFSVDEDAVKTLFDTYDVDGNGQIDIVEFTRMLVKMGVAPTKAAKVKNPDV